MAGFILCGTGKRATTIYNLSKKLKGPFSVNSVFTHKRERAFELKEKGINATSNLDEALSFPHSAVIVATSPENLVSLILELHKRNERIVCETSFLSLNEDEVKKIEGIKCSVLEVYPLNPIIESIKTLSDELGEIQSIYLNMVHSHHASALFEVFIPSWKKSHSCFIKNNESVAKSDNRDKRIIDKDEIDNSERTISVTVTEDGKLLINDFFTNIYRNELRPNRFEIRGKRGVVTESYFIREENGKVKKDLIEPNLAFIKFSDENFPKEVKIGTRVVYSNEYYHMGLSSDEIALAKALKRVLNDSSTTYYSLDRALSDRKKGLGL